MGPKDQLALLDISVLITQLVALLLLFPPVGPVSPSSSQAADFCLTKKRLAGHGATVITEDQQANLSSRGQGQNNRNSQYAGRETRRLGDESQYQSV